MGEAYFGTIWWPALIFRFDAIMGWNQQWQWTAIAAEQQQQKHTINLRIITHNTHTTHVELLWYAKKQNEAAACASMGINIVCVWVWAHFMMQYYAFLCCQWIFIVFISYYTTRISCFLPLPKPIAVFFFHRYHSRLLLRHSFAFPIPISKQIQFHTY